MIKTAVIGAGSIGIEHLTAIEHSDEFELCAVCDTNTEKAEVFGEKYCVPVFADYHDIPGKTDAEAVILNLPHFLHCEAAVFFLEHGIHVLVEKPMANTVAECDKMLEAAKKSGKKLAVGHVQRYFAANRAVKECIESGRLGKFIMYEERRTTNYFDKNRPKWFLQKSTSGGGIVMNYGAHAIDKIFYMVGAQKPEIFSVCANSKNACDIEGHAQYMMRFKDGFSASVTFSGYGCCGYEVIYYFTDGALNVSDGIRLREYKNGKWEDSDVCEDGLFMDRQLKEFANFIEGKESEITDGEYGKAVISAIEKIYEN